MPLLGTGSVTIGHSVCDLVTIMTTLSAFTVNWIRGEITNRKKCEQPHGNRIHFTQYHLINVPTQFGKLLLNRSINIGHKIANFML